MVKPLIGLVADTKDGRHRLHTIHEKYLDAVSAGAGALAVVLPARIDRPGAAWHDERDIDAVLDRLDAIVLTGGVSNIEPRHYGQALHDPASPADPARDGLTLALARRAIARGLPTLGICRGFQEINVALGGTLHQRVHAVPGLADHRDPDDAPIAVQYQPAHRVEFARGGALHRFTGLDEAEVNSLHGQGIDRLAPGLVADAMAPDGLIEAFRGADPDRFLLGVQWHPEWHFRDNAVSVALFRALGQAARVTMRQPAIA